MQTVLLIFVVLFALAIGFFLGIFLISLDTPLTKSLIKKEDKTAEDGLPESSGTVSSEIQKPSPDSRLILQIWREEGKPPVYEQDGNFYEKEQLPRDLLNVITIAEEIPSQQVSPPPPVLDDKPTPVELPEVEDEIEEEEVKMLSVVDEVNDILQKKLVGSPLAGKGIHLMENHNNEIRFWVGLNSYNDVEEIPDQEVRKIIDESVKEWEKNRE